MPVNARTALYTSLFRLRTFLRLQAMEIPDVIAVITDRAFAQFGFSALCNRAKDRLVELNIRQGPMTSYRAQLLSMSLQPCPEMNNRL